MSELWLADRSVSPAAIRGRPVWPRQPQSRRALSPTPVPAPAMALSHRYPMTPRLARAPRLHPILCAALRFLQVRSVSRRRTPLPRPGRPSCSAAGPEHHAAGRGPSYAFPHPVLPGPRRQRWRPRSAPRRSPRCPKWKGSAKRSRRCQRQIARLEERSAGETARMNCEFAQKVFLSRGFHECVVQPAL